MKKKVVRQSSINRSTDHSQDIITLCCFVCLVRLILLATILQSITPNCISRRKSNVTFHICQYFFLSFFHFIIMSVSFSSHSNDKQKWNRWQWILNGGKQVHLYGRQVNLELNKKKRKKFNANCNEQKQKYVIFNQNLWLFVVFSLVRVCVLLFFFTASSVHLHLVPYCRAAIILQ